MAQKYKLRPNYKNYEPPHLGWQVTPRPVQLHVHETPQYGWQAAAQNVHTHEPPQVGWQLRPHGRQATS